MTKPGEGAVLVHRQGDMRAAFAHLAQEVDRALALGNEQARLQERRPPRPGLLRPEQVLGEEDADHVVVAAVVDRVARVAVGDHLRLDLVEGQGVGEEHDVGARALHVANVRPFEPEHGLEHGVLELRDVPFLPGDREQEAHVLRPRGGRGVIERDPPDPRDEVGEARGAAPSPA